MNLYLAPMEEVTGYVFRNVLNRHFGGVDKFFTPFISPNQNKIMKTRDGREIIPEHNKGLNVAVQILTNNAPEFNELARFLYDTGYREINLNMGCPSGTVVKKGRGSGILKDTYDLEKFLDGVFNAPDSAYLACDGLQISVKTRLGYDTDALIEDIMEVYNSFPISELTVHARIRSDFYDGEPRMEAFKTALSMSKCPVCYNGNIFTVKDYETLLSTTSADAVMIGRGAVKNPGIFREIKTGRKTDRHELDDFIVDLYDVYSAEFGEKDGIFKMKEAWSYFCENYEDSAKVFKKIRKCTSPADYRNAVREIISGS